MSMQQACFNPEYRMRDKLNHKEKIIKDKIKEISFLKVKLKEKDLEMEILREEIIKLKKEVQEVKLKEKTIKTHLKETLYEAISNSILKKKFKKNMKE